MKPRSRSVIVLLVLLVIFPLLIDALITALMPATNFGRQKISNGLFENYLLLLPWFVLYLTIAFTIIYFYNRYKKRKR